MVRPDFAAVSSAPCEKSRRGGSSEIPFVEHFQNRRSTRPESHDHAQSAQRVELFEEIRHAVTELRRCGLVLRRRTTYRGRNEAIVKAQAVVAIDRVGLRCEPGAVERRIEKVARRIAGKGTPGSIAPVRPGRKADEHQPRARIAEGRNGPAPIDALAMRAFAFARDLRGVGAQLRTARTPDDRRLYSFYIHCRTSAYSMPPGATT